jgi:membrane protein implicated in regulation of membrane protease activity
MRTSPRMLVVFTFATFLVVGGVVALATGSWWVLPLAVGVHAVGTAFVSLVIFRALESHEKPDPTTEARLDEEAEERDRDEPRMAI